MGQGVRIVGDLVDVEEQRAGNVGQGVLMLAVALLVRKKPAGVDDTDVGRPQMILQPGGGDEGIDVGHARGLYLIFPANPGSAGRVPSGRRD